MTILLSLWLAATPVSGETATSPSQRTGAASVGRPWGEVTGILQFRGNPTHTWYGEGPLPRSPEVLWRFPRQRKMCALSRTGGRSRGPGRDQRLDTTLDRRGR